MSPIADETAEDLPVRDVGLTRGGLMPTVPDTLRDVKTPKKHNLMKTKDPQRLFRFPREHLEDLCLRLQDENNVLRQHSRTQEQRLRRVSTRLMRLRQSSPGSGGLKERDLEDTIQELEARVSTLESQKEVLQNKLSLARQHVMDLSGGRTTHKISKSKSMEAEGAVRRATQTAPARFVQVTEDNRTEMERFRSSVAEQVRVMELELTAQALRDTLREKEKEVEGTLREMKRQHADKHRITIRENVDVIHLQKELSDKSTALRAAQMKYDDLQKACENQLEESQRSLKENLGVLLQKVEELSEQLKQEKLRAQSLQDQLSSANLSLQNQDKLQERISDLEGERDMIKENYDSLLENTLSAHVNHDGHVEKKPSIVKCEDVVPDIQRLKRTLEAEREEKSRLELVKEKMRQEREMMEEQRDKERELTVIMKNKQERLEQEVLQRREQVIALQGRIDSVTQEFDMSVEELSETLLQIKLFRKQQESKESLGFLSGGEHVEVLPRDFVNIQAALAENGLELQKTRKLLLVEHQICKDLKEELRTVSEKMEKQKEESKQRIAVKDNLLSKRALQINTLQAQLKELAYSPRNYKRTVPIQYTWPAGDQELLQPTEEDLCFSQLRAGESLLEIHLKAATFTPLGLRMLTRLGASVDTAEDFVTFCTYSFLDFEMHSTPLVAGSQPNYGFTSRYALTPRDLGRLGGQGSRVRVELHQALGGVRFVTHGSGQMSVLGALQRRGENVNGRVHITGPEAESVGVVDFWVRLYPPAEPMIPEFEKLTDSRTAAPTSPFQIPYGWQDGGNEEVLDYGVGIPNELVVMLERCVGLTARWPGSVPDAYLTYRLYDLPPHVSPTAQCTADPVFNDTSSYPLAVTTDVLQYLRSSSLYVYVFDDSDDQMPPAYLAKTPVPLQDLATGREIRGDYVLRDPAGGPRGIVRVMIKWKYPFQPPDSNVLGSWKTRNRTEKDDEREERQREKADVSHRPVAKPRIKPPTVRQKSLKNLRAEEHHTSVRSTDKKPSTKSTDLQYVEPQTTNSQLRAKSSFESASSKKSAATLSRGSSISAARSQELLFSVVSTGNEEKMKRNDRAHEEDSEETDQSESSSSESDIIIIPPKCKLRKREKLRVEILSLSFEPSSHVVRDKSVQQVYVEYRLLGVPMETTETPMSLRKPRRGEEIHYNFTRVIYVDGSQSGPLRRYLYSMLEGTDPNRGRLIFTVVSEPMDDDDECVDVGQAFLELHELLLTGNDVIEQQIDIVSVDKDKEVIGNLKVSLEAAKALAGIYQEFHLEDRTDKEETSENEDEEEEEEKKDKDMQQDKGKEEDDKIQVIDYEEDSDF